MYYILLEMIKELNFDAFIDIKRKLFYFNEDNSNDSENSTFRVRNKNKYIKILYYVLV